MTGIRNVLGAFVFLLLAATLFAASISQPGSSLLAPADTLISMVVVQPADATGCVDPTQKCVLSATVFAFEPATSTTGVDKRAALQKIYQDCLTNPAYPNNVQGCMIAQSAERFGNPLQSVNPPISVQNARLVFKSISTVTGQPVTMAGCEDKRATIRTDGTIPLSCDPSQPSTCTPLKITYYSAQCQIPDDLRTGNPTTEILVEFDPSGVVINNMEVLPSTGTFTIRNPPGTIAATLSSQLGQFIAGMAEGKGYPGGNALPCVGIFLILGLLLASLYFSGKSPVSLLDITTPKLPAPKGVAAGGQILLPYGWSELKAGVKAKKASAAGALAKSLAVLGVAKGANQEETVRNALNALGQKAKISRDKLAQLTKKLPYQYGDAEHQTISEIFKATGKMGPREALMADMAKDYMLSIRTMQSLDKVTGHLGIDEKTGLSKSPLMTNIDKFMNVTGLNANRYAVLGGGLTAGMASAVRTNQMLWRGTKHAVKAAPEVVAKTTMTLMGARSIAELERISPTAAWFSKKLTTHAGDVFVGTYYPILNKMGRFYETLHEETLHDEMRHILMQLYKKAGLNFSITEEEVVKMGYMDLNILKRCGCIASAELAAIDAGVRRILSNNEFRDSHGKIMADKLAISQQKLQQLVAFAESYGVNCSSITFLNTKLGSIMDKAEPDHLKLGMVNQALEDQRNYGKAALKRAGADDVYVCHVGSDSLKGTAVFETLVLRTMIWDAEHGHLNGGIAQALTSARLNVSNRVTGLDAVKGMEQLPAYMRDKAELEKLAARNKSDMISLFTEEGRQEFTKVKGKGMNSASISEIVDFMYGGATPRTLKDTVNGRTVWWGADRELELPSRFTLVDVKRHWVTALDPRENFALGQWVESRFTKSYVPHFDAEIEAQLNSTSGSDKWSMAKRTEEAKKLLLAKQVNLDMENRYNSQFAQNAYGTTSETLRFYNGIMAGVLRKVMQDPIAQGGKGLESNHEDMRNLEGLDAGKLNDLMKKYGREVETQLQKKITYDDVIRSNQAMVMLHEGGLAYYHKGMMLSDMDRILNGEVALRDDKGQYRKFMPDNIAIKFDNEALTQEFAKVRSSKRPADWDRLLDAAREDKKQGPYNYEKEKVFAALLWQYANATYDYGKFWHESAVTVQQKRDVTPLAPSPLRFFGAEASGLSTMLKPFRDIGLHLGDYISTVSLAAGGPVHTAAYDIAPVSEYYRQHSFKLSSKILSGEALKGLSEDERVAYRAAAVDHFAFHQVWDYAIDRNPWRQSTSFGAHQAWGSFFHFGPAQVYSLKENLGASMDTGQYRNFMAFYGFPLDLAGKMMRPYTSMIRGMQMSMQGYASKWDASGDALRQWNYTTPRMLEAMQSVNPFSFKWFPGKNWERLQKLNVYGGSLEKHQLAGADFTKGLLQAPQDIYLNRKGVYASARTDEANPGLSHYTYRHELVPEATAAEYLIRMREAAFMYDSKVQEQAMSNTVRRTVSAEALAIRRDQELRSFGIMQNPLYGWSSPIAALWHTPIPGMELLHLSPKDWVAKWVEKSKTGGRSISFSERIQSMAESTGKFLTRVTQPAQLSRVVYCPKCQMPNIRGSYCKNPACRQAQY